MHLQHLSVSGFKSFAKKSELEFSSSITAIVGPNGSGKSNVSEAFRFVLGEQSLKSMRSKKGEDLIFGGSESTARGNRASVTVKLNNTNRVFPLDYDEISVERNVHRDGQNEYKINGAKVRLKDVQELFAAANIGTTGHHIISQGEADRILTASPKDRREMIEDALGLKVFQYKKIDAERKLKKTENNIEKVQSLRKEVAPHMQFLERQIKKMERAVELRKELTASYLEYLRREDVYIAFHHDKVTLKKKELEEVIERLTASLDEAKKTIESHKKDAKSEELLAVETELRDVRNNKAELNRQRGQIEGQVSYLERRINEMQNIVAGDDDAPIPVGEVKVLVKAIEKAADGVLQSNDVPKLQRAVSDIVHTAKKFLQDAVGTVAVPDTKREEKEKQQLSEQLSVVAKSIEEVVKKEELFNQEYDKVRQSIEAEQSESRDAEREYFKINAEKREQENLLLQVESELSSLDRDRSEFKREIQEAVTLIGKDASMYYDYEIVANGSVVPKAKVVAEERTVQYERRRQLEKMKIRLEELGGVNEDIEKEFNEVKERDDFLVREIADLESSVAKLQELIQELTLQLNERFEVGVEKIDMEFTKFFTLMFGGGTAKLIKVAPKPVKKNDSEDFAELEDVESEEDEDNTVLSDGIDLDIKLPNKRVRGLDMLSGGERALTSIALIFAMSQVNPPLFIILDETDAALDEANSRRYGDMIAALSEKSQLILITHNRETMSRAGILYGVTMGGDGVSKLLSVKFDEATLVAK